MFQEQSVLVRSREVRLGIGLHPFCCASWYIFDDITLQDLHHGMINWFSYLKKVLLLLSFDDESVKCTITTSELIEKEASYILKINIFF